VCVGGWVGGGDTCSERQTAPTIMCRVWFTRRCPSQGEGPSGPGLGHKVPHHMTNLNLNGAAQPCSPAAAGCMQVPNGLVNPAD
jgi:hypothetical protein